MEQEINDLKEIRARFEIEAKKRRMSAQTKKRYQSWIRRFILYCRDSGLPIAQISAKAFLESYQSPHSRRQGYYALKLLFTRLAHRKHFFEFNALIPIGWRPKRRKLQKRNWWN